MDNEEFTLVCPCCNASLTVDESGDLELIQRPELAENQKFGLGGVRVEYFGATPRDVQLFNQQDKKKRESLLDVPVLGNNPKALQFEADKAIETANTNDLKRRNIQPTEIN